MPSISGSTQTGNPGSGYVRITVIEAGGSLPFRVKVSGAIKEVTAGYVKVNGTWKEISAAYTKVNGTWKEAANVKVKVNGTWKDVSVVHKNVNGYWQQQSDISDMFDPNALYFKG